jgi:hypothetical protein
MKGTFPSRKAINGIKEVCFPAPIFSGDTDYAILNFHVYLLYIFEVIDMDRLKQQLRIWGVV